MGQYGVDERQAAIDRIQITIARVDGVRDRRPRNHTMSWGERKVEVLSAAASPRRGSATAAEYERDRQLSKNVSATVSTRRAAKDRCLAQKNGPATIGGECVAVAGDPLERNAANFPSWSTLVFDIDPGQCTEDFFAALLEGSARIRVLGAAVWHETYSSIEGRRAVRIEMLLRLPTATADRNAAGQALASYIEADFVGLKIDRASLKNVQIMFDPACASDAPPRLAGVLFGEPLDAAALAASSRSGDGTVHASVVGQGAVHAHEGEDDVQALARRAREILGKLGLQVEPGHASTVAFACLCPHASHQRDGVARAEWTEDGLWICRVCGSGGGLIPFITMLNGCTAREAFQICRRTLGLPAGRYRDSAPRAAARDAAPQTRPGDYESDRQTAETERGDDGPGRRSQADILTDYGDECDLYVDATDGDGVFADVRVHGHRETMRVASSYFRSWLQHKYYSDYRKAARGESISQALSALEARARFEGECRKQFVYLRSAAAGGSIYIDLCNDARSAIEVTPDGWQIVAEPPVRFRRTKGMAELPTPVQGQIDTLKQFVNLKTDSDFILFVSWLLHTLRGQPPFPLLSVLGQEGTAKTTLCRIAKLLTDPNANPLRALPGNAQDMLVGAISQYVLVYDNVSSMGLWLSDALCRMAYGAGASYRRLFSDDEESVLAAARPVVLNGIVEHVTRGDLASRTIGINLEVIPPEARRDEEEFWADFYTARPGILGALLDGLVSGLTRLPSVRRRSLPRMADFARWGMACEVRYWEEGSFEKAYAANIAVVASETLETDSVIVCLRSWLEAPERDGRWDGPTSTLLKLLKAECGGEKPRDWPANSQAFRGTLRRCAPALAGVGIKIVFSRKNSRSYATIETIERGETPCAGASTASPHVTDKGSNVLDAPDAPAQGSSPPAGSAATEHPPKGFIDPETGDEADGAGGWVLR